MGGGRGKEKSCEGALPKKGNGGGLRGESGSFFFPPRGASDLSRPRGTRGGGEGRRKGKKGGNQNVRHLKRGRSPARRVRLRHGEEKGRGGEGGGNNVLKKLGETEGKTNVECRHGEERLLLVTLGRKGEGKKEPPQKAKKNRVANGDLPIKKTKSMGPKTPSQKRAAIDGAPGGFGGEKRGRGKNVPVLKKKIAPGVRRKSKQERGKKQTTYLSISDRLVREKKGRREPGKKTNNYPN